MRPPWIKQLRRQEFSGLKIHVDPTLKSSGQLHFVLRNFSALTVYVRAHVKDKDILMFNRKQAWEGSRNLNGRGWRDPVVMDHMEVVITCNPKTAVMGESLVEAQVTMKLTVGEQDDRQEPEPENTHRFEYFSVGYDRKRRTFRVV